ncbi:uncharacterized protein LOC135843470 isoform X3 [Planococcus citri]|uniref:uncharacterized protein LOC135843470 isoform X3 n=1 Tax=Planococcus citri TaxID=170843 RepID=UPI0031F8607B
MERNDVPVFFASPLSLQELVSRKVALCLWFEKFRNTASECARWPYFDVFDMLVFSEVTIDVPFPIKRMIESGFDPVIIELLHWLKNSNRVLYHMEINDIYTRLDLVAFGGNGTIHFRGTIANFLNDSSLSDLVRFKIACVFCFEEQIDALWPIVCDEPELNIDDMYFHNDFMLFYWIARKKQDKLSEMLVPERGGIDHNKDIVTKFSSCTESPERGVPDHKSIDYLKDIIGRCYGCNLWLAMEYFMKLLDPVVQLKMVDDIFSSYSDPVCTVHLLPSLDAHLQRRILNKLLCKVVIDMARTFTRAEYATQAWLFIKDLIGKDKFSRMINTIIDLNCQLPFEFIQKDELLACIWSSASIHLKDVSDTLLNSVVSTLVIDFIGRISFLAAVLSSAEIPIRLNFWNQNWPKLISSVSQAQFEELMKVCLVEQTSIDDFERRLKNEPGFQEFY